MGFGVRAAGFDMTKLLRDIGPPERTSSIKDGDERRGCGGNEQQVPFDFAPAGCRCASGHVGMTADRNMKRSVGTDGDNVGNRTGIGMMGTICEAGGVESREKKNVWKGRNG